MCVEDCILPAGLGQPAATHTGNEDGNADTGPDDDDVDAAQAVEVHSSNTQDASHSRWSAMRKKASQGAGASQAPPRLSNPNLSLWPPQDTRTSNSMNNSGNLSELSGHLLAPNVMHRPFSTRSAAAVAGLNSLDLRPATAAAPSSSFMLDGVDPDDGVAGMAHGGGLSRTCDTHHHDVPVRQVDLGHLPPMLFIATPSSQPSSGQPSPSRYAASSQPASNLSARPSINREGSASSSGLWAGNSASNLLSIPSKADGGMIADMHSGDAIKLEDMHEGITHTSLPTQAAAASPDRYVNGSLLKPVRVPSAKIQASMKVASVMRISSDQSHGREDQGLHKITETNHNDNMYMSAVGRNSNPKQACIAGSPHVTDQEQLSSSAVSSRSGREADQRTLAAAAAAALVRPAGPTPGGGIAGRLVQSARPSTRDGTPIDPSVWHDYINVQLERPPSRQRPPPEALHLWSPLQEGQTAGQIDWGGVVRKPSRPHSAMPTTTMSFNKPAFALSNGPIHSNAGKTALTAGVVKSCSADKPVANPAYQTMQHHHHGMRPPTRQKPPPMSVLCEYGDEFEEPQDAVAGDANSGLNSNNTGMNQSNLDHRSNVSNDVQSAWS